MAGTIDLNCDCGESFGPWQMGADAALLPWVSSANIACGFHAGDAQTMQATIGLCIAHGVSIGAHPGLRDLQGFGRRELKVNAVDVYTETLYQMGALAALCRSQGTGLKHVKPHGALYHQLDREHLQAQAFVDAVRALDGQLRVFGPAGGQLQQAAKRTGLVYCREGFVERSYGADGRLLARQLVGAVLHDEAAIIDQAVELAINGRVWCRSEGAELWLAQPVETLCIHGDRPDAASLAQHIRSALQGCHFRVSAPAQ